MKYKAAIQKLSNKELILLEIAEMEMVMQGELPAFRTPEEKQWAEKYDLSQLVEAVIGKEYGCNVKLQLLDRGGWVNKAGRLVLPATIAVVHFIAKSGEEKKLKLDEKILTKIERTFSKQLEQNILSQRIIVVYSPVAQKRLKLAMAKSEVRLKSNEIDEILYYQFRYFHTVIEYCKFLLEQNKVGIN